MKKILKYLFTIKVYSLTQLTWFLIIYANYIKENIDFLKFVIYSIIYSVIHELIIRLFFKNKEDE
jgi:hypothetical protein